MLPDLLNALEQSAPVALLRTSFWLYPLVNAAHIIGIALLAGSIITYDLAVLRPAARNARSVLPSLATLQPVFLPVASVALILAILTGFLLFSVKASEYAANPALRIKLGVIALGLFNIAWVKWRPVYGRPAALLSIVVWIAAIIAGRFIAFV